MKTLVIIVTFIFIHLHLIHCKNIPTLTTTYKPYGETYNFLIHGGHNILTDSLSTTC